MQDHRAVGEFDKRLRECKSLAKVSLDDLVSKLAPWSASWRSRENGAYQRSQPSAIAADKNECYRDQPFTQRSNR